MNSASTLKASLASRKWKSRNTIGNWEAVFNSLVVPAEALVVGVKVEVQYQQLPEYYSAVIKAVNEDGYGALPSLSANTLSNKPRLK
jgi:hypothetical protein